jgi:hypothetical protein
MLTNDQLDAYYKDLICKSYCSVAVPGAIRDLRRANPKMTIMQATRIVMRQRILDEAERGNYPRAHVQELLERLDEPLRNGRIRNRQVLCIAKRLHSRAMKDLEQYTPKGKMLTAIVSESFHFAFSHTAAANSMSMTDLLKKILTQWAVDNVGEGVLP